MDWLKNFNFKTFFKKFKVKISPKINWVSFLCNKINLMKSMGNKLCKI